MKKLKTCAVLLSAAALLLSAGCSGGKPKTNEALLTDDEKACGEMQLDSLEPLLLSFGAEPLEVYDVVPDFSFHENTGNTYKYAYLAEVPVTYGGERFTLSLGFDEDMHFGSWSYIAESNDAFYPLYKAVTEDLGEVAAVSNIPVANTVTEYWKVSDGAQLTLMMIGEQLMLGYTESSGSLDYHDAQPALIGAEGDEQLAKCAEALDSLPMIAFASNSEIIFEGTELRSKDEYVIRVRDWTLNVLYDFRNRTDSYNTFIDIMKETNTLTREGFTEAGYGNVNIVTEVYDGFDSTEPSVIIKNGTVTYEHFEE